MLRRPPRAKRTDTLFPYTTRFRSLFLCSFVVQRSSQADLWGGMSLSELCTSWWRRQSNGGRLSDRLRRRLRWLLLHGGRRSEEHTSELQSLMRISYAVFCLKKKK